jgi:hypothetical protein
MAAARCCVSFEDPEGAIHSAHIQAESVYEAVAMAIAEFREDPLVSKPGPMTEFTVALERPLLEHRIRLNLVEKRAEATTKEGPAGITKRKRVRTLLGNQP